MDHPTRIFVLQDYMLLVADNDKNLKEIQAFHPKDNKLALMLEKNFSDQSLLKVSEVLSHSFERWKLTNVL